MNKLDINKYPALAKLSNQLVSEQHIKKLYTNSRTEKTKQGLDLSNRLKKLFGDASYYFSFLGVQDKPTATAYLSSLKRSRKHSFDRMKLIEVLEAIEMGEIQPIVETLKISRLMSKTQQNKTLRDKFINNEITVQELENIFSL